MSKKKSAVDLRAQLGGLVVQAQDKADQRFARAQEVLVAQPGALTPAPAAAPSSSGATAIPTLHDPSTAVIGVTYRVPLTLVDPNPRGARVFYRTENVEVVVESFNKSGQDNAANGYVKNGRVYLIDGGTRLRGARATGLSSLEVKIEAEPEDDRALFKRSLQLNSERSSHTELDMAVNIERLLGDGVYGSADELAADLGISKSEVSMYRRVAKIPQKLLMRMNDHDKTASKSISYEISSLVTGDDYERDPDTRLQLAEEVVEAIQENDMTRDQVKALIAAKLEGPKPRQRADATAIKFRGKSGVMKVFIERGQLDFTIKGLSREALEEAQGLIEKAMAGQMPLS